MRAIDRQSRIVVDGQTARILLPNGMEALINANDAERCVAYVWYYCKSRKIGYVAGYTLGGKSRKRISLHRLIIGAGNGQMVDHRDQDGLNNRKANLRLCSRSENGANNRRLGGRAGFKGVKLDARTGKFIARLPQAKRDIHLGIFESAETAARAYDKAALRAYGSFARLNFPEGRA